MLPIIFWSVLAFVIVQPLLAFVAEMDNQIQALSGFKSVGVGIIGIIFAVVFRIFGAEWFNSVSSCFWLYIVLFIPASVFFARKYASLYLIKTGSEGSKSYADPLGLSELFLILLLFLGQRFAQNGPSTGYLVTYFLFGIVTTFIGIGWFESERDGLWRKDLKIDTYSSSGSSSSSRSDFPVLGIFIRILNWVSVLASYLGLPLLVVFLLPTQTVWVWVGVGGYMLAFFVPIVGYAITKFSGNTKLKHDYATLKQAEQKGDVESIAMVLDDVRLSDVTEDILRKWLKTDPALFDKLAQIYTRGVGGWRLGHILWFYGVLAGKTHDLERAEILVDSLASKTIPAPVRASVLHTMVTDKTFFSSALLQKALPQAMSDENLMSEFKKYGINLTLK